MREIKFRAWEEDEKQMRLGGFQIWFDSHGEIKDVPPCDKYCLMQFTGLLDKNGKEIYEGDIVLTGFPAEVYFEDGAFCLKNKSVENGALVKDVFNMFPFEIIGNIYQNSDLLK